MQESCRILKAFKIKNWMTKAEVTEMRLNTTVYTQINF